MRKKMTTKSKDELLEIYKPMYTNADRKGKSKILDTITQSTGMSRKHVIALLRELSVPSAIGRRGRKPVYDHSTIDVLRSAWIVADHICSKRLVPFLPQILTQLEKAGMTIQPETRTALERISARTVDRLLHIDRQKHNRSLCTTKRSNLVKSKIPIRTFTEWDGVKPGFFEADTVSHCASSSAGSFLSTLNMTDIATGWTEPFALLRKGSSDVIAGFEKACQLVPFPILGLDCDNGTEFLNEYLIRWCEGNRITFTRSRAYKKNDQAWIEQKNRSVVRKHVGRARFEGLETWKLLTEYYAHLRLYVNFFQPCQKLLLKKRNGAKTYKRHDMAKTPCERVLENEHISNDLKEKVREQRESLSMVAIHAELAKLDEKLKRMAVDAPITVAPLKAIQRMATFKFIEKPAVEPPELQTNTPQKNLHAVKTRTAKGKTKPIMHMMRNRILKLDQGEIFSAPAFLDLAARSTVDTYLAILTKKKLITKVSYGRYTLLPKQHRVEPKRYPKKRRASVR